MSKPTMKERSLANDIHNALLDEAENENLASGNLIGEGTMLPEKSYELILAAISANRKKAKP